MLIYSENTIECPVNFKHSLSDIFLKIHCPNPVMTQLLTLIAYMIIVLLDYIYQFFIEREKFYCKIIYLNLSKETARFVQVFL